MSFSNVLTRSLGFRPLSRLKNPGFLPSRYVHNLFPNDLSILVDELRAPEHPHAIHYNYPALVTQLHEWRKNVHVAPPLNKHHLIVILQKLGESGRPADLQRIEDILADMSSVFGVEPSPDIHTIILHALKKNGNMQTLYRWLLHIPSRPGNFRPTIDQYHVVLEACSELGSFKQMRNMVLSMRKAGCKPVVETFRILVRARWQYATEEGKVPHLAVFSTILEDMKREGLPYDQTLSDMLFSGYADRGMSAYARQIQSLFERQFPKVQPGDEQNLSWIFKLSRASQYHGVKGAMETFRSLEKEGCKADPATVRALLRHSLTLSDLEYVEKELELKPSIDVYSRLIDNCARAGHIAGALALFNRAKSEGLKPDAPSVAPLIKSLCQKIGDEPPERSLDKAILLYQGLSSCHPSDIATEDKASYLEHSAGPDLNIYQMLLRGLASSSNIQKYFPVAMSLLEDMDVRGVSKNDSITASSIIVLHMRNAEQPADALDAYQMHRSALDEKGYAVVLHAYSKLTFGSITHVPSLIDYFGIVRDMRQAGFAITAEVYTILLKRLALLATQLSQGGHIEGDISGNVEAEFRISIIATTRRVHDLLTLDANISPDAHVWNQLMDTYQRLGCFGDSYRVWELLYLSGMFDHVSVSIILDACGYAGAWQVAKQVRQRLARDRFRLNERNWNAWIECLCRLGRLNDAVKTVCIEMGKEEVTVDVESVRILLKFARKAGRQDEVVSRIQQHLPDLWTSLHEEFQVS